MKKFFILLTLLFLTFTSCTFAAERILLSIDLIRHGARTPLKKLPNSTIKWKEGMGRLTKKGIAMQKNLGAQLRKRYVAQDHLLPAKYDPKTIYVRTTYIMRTQNSAKALLLGLYPNLPNGVSIPIHTVSKEKDSLLLAKPSQAFFDKIKLYLYKTYYWYKKMSPLSNELKYWSKLTGMKLTDFHSFDLLADNLTIRKETGHAPPSGMSQDEANKIIQLNTQIMLDKFRLKEVSGPSGSKILANVIKQAEAAIQHKSTLRYILYMAHDSTILSLLNQLHIPKIGYPAYASRVNFLVTENNERFYIKVSFNNKLIATSQCKQSCQSWHTVKE
jgi:Histidine phosphatase superfamily (branch 2)